MARTIDWQRTGGKTQRVTVTSESVVDSLELFFALQGGAQANLQQLSINAAQAEAARYNMGVSLNGHPYNSARNINPALPFAGLF